MSVKELRLFLLAVLGTKSEAIADIIKTFDPTTTAHVLSNPVSDHLTLEDQVIDRLISPQYTRFLARLLSQHLSFGDSSGNEVSEPHNHRRSVLTFFRRFRRSRGLLKAHTLSSKHR